MKNFKFELFGSVWKVKFVEKVKDPDNNHDGEFCYGITTSYNNTIQIATKDYEGVPIVKEELAITILHEIIHAVLRTGQYGEDSEKEHLVEWLARCIYAMLKQKIFKNLE